VNLTEVTIRDSSGIRIGATFQHGTLINPGNYATLSQGIAYSGSNVTIGALSEYGNLFTTSCHA
jgi:ribosomal protein L27